ncbi:MAG TPA: cation:proton antiporter [Tepidisphaeraceae bacterium]|nr:cation:proton antiporter [Tepidisphaeraceae bacterium]
MPALAPTRLKGDWCSCVRWLVLLLGIAGMALWAGPAWASGGGEAFHLSPDLSELSQLGESARTYRMMVIIFQIAAMLASAKLLGWLAELVRVPGVIGELLAGVLIGPYMLGSMIPLPIDGQWVSLFPKPMNAQQWPVNDVIWAIAQFASIVLLFVTGLHTDLKQFVRYIGPATLVAVVGLLAPFALGAGVVYLPMFSELARPAEGGSLLVPALFVGAILAATSIGITARVLTDIERLDTPEGVTILGAAVLDDVLGIVALAIVGGIASAGSISLPTIGGIAGRAFGFWLGLTALSLALARPLEKLIGRVKYSGAMIGLGLAIAFASSGAAEGFGLAFIIGAYSVGLGLSRTQMAHRLMVDLRPISEFVVPIFFTSLGMLVNLGAVFGDWRVVVFGLAVTLVAIIGKLIGCGVSAYATGFNVRGAYRVGVGMMPRGEVALIVAGIGLSRHLIRESVFGVSIMMTLLTTILAPLLLVPAFRGGSGRRKPETRPDSLPSEAQFAAIKMSVSEDLAEPLARRLLSVLESHGWMRTYDLAEENAYLLRNNGDAAQVQIEDGQIRIDASGERQEELRRLLEEAREWLSRDASSAGAVGSRSPAE